jgi:ATP-dependent Lon protease
VLKIIREYTREAGVRSLARNIATICRKVAAQIVKTGRKSPAIKPQQLSEYLGPPKIWQELEIAKSNVGMVTGLAWTESGGETLPIEVSLMPGKGNLQLTGQLGEIMKESAQAAFSYIRSHAKQLGIEPNFQESLDIHIHLPEGAIPKDGPSAGIAMALALVSAITSRPVRGNLAMTGEITLRGRVLAIGGLKEKVLAAVRAGITTVLYPQQTQKDLVEIPKYIHKKVKLIPISHLDEVLKIAFGTVPAPKKLASKKAATLPKRSARKKPR